MTINDTKKYLDYKNKYIELKLLYNKEQNGGFWNIFNIFGSNVISNTLPLIDVNKLIENNRTTNTQIKNVYILTNDRNIFSLFNNSFGTNYIIIEPSLLENITTYVKDALDLYIKNPNQNIFTKHIYQKYHAKINNDEIIFHFQKIDDNDNSNIYKFIIDKYNNNEINHKIKQNISYISTDKNILTKFQDLMNLQEKKFITN